jgi:hypothetical protein
MSARVIGIDIGISGAPAVLPATIPSLIERARASLAEARTSAEILEAKEMASFAYDCAKRCASSFARFRGFGGSGAISLNRA